MLPGRKRRASTVATKITTLPRRDRGRKPYLRRAFFVVARRFFELGDFLARKLQIAIPVERVQARSRWASKVIMTFFLPETPDMSVLLAHFRREV
jgi:hypothetical protein